MTNKEAIKILENYHNGYFGYKIDDVHEAHKLAIKALRRADCVYLKDECSFACGECGHCEAEKGGAE